jgi:acetate kinase
LDALVFTAGIGENDALIRQSVCDGLTALGITLDHERNRSGASANFDISAKTSQVKVLVVATNEELEIAHQTVAVINKCSS